MESMACASLGLAGGAGGGAARPPPATSGDVGGGMRRSASASDVRCGGADMRRSRSEPHLRCTLTVARSAAVDEAKTSIFPFNLSAPPPSIIPSSLRSFLFDPPASGKPLADRRDEDEEERRGGQQRRARANWVERILELRQRWSGRQNNPPDPAGDGGEEEDDDEDYGVCVASYDSLDGGGEEWDQESFSALLSPVTWSETELFSKLVFLSNMAYVIPELKAEYLRKWYGLLLVTSSMEKRTEAAAIKAILERDTLSSSSRRLADDDAPPGALPTPPMPPRRRPVIPPSVAYDIAASAAAHIRHSRARWKGSPPAPAGDSAAAFVAATAMTAVVAAEEVARQEAAKELQSLHSSPPCEWFVCDDPGTCTRCFVIQGSESLASWQANLFFEPIKFEGTEAMVHRGIYEAANGMYKRFLPEVTAHLRRHGSATRLRFTGHSLGGSLSLIVALMLLSRGAAPRSALLPVVTFGAPSVFCGGRMVLEELGLDEGFICSVMMHRDIVPRAFSCDYPFHVAALLKRINGSFRSLSCLNNQKLLYSPLGQLFILQPEERLSPAHHLLPPGAALYALARRNNGGGGGPLAAMRAALAFFNSSHPLEMLSHPSAYGSEGTVLRDHDSSNYVRAINGLLRKPTRMVARRRRRRQPIRLRQWLPGNPWAGGAARAAGSSSHELLISFEQPVKPRAPAPEVVIRRKEVASRA